MNNYSKWEKLLAEVTESEDENLDLKKHLEILKNENKEYFFSNYIKNITNKQKESILTLEMELEKGGNWKDYNTSIGKEDFFEKRMNFMINSSRKCIKLLEKCLNVGIDGTVMAQILLDDPGVRFYYLLVPFCLRHLHCKYNLCASIFGPENRLTIAHVSAFWGYDNFLLELFIEKNNFNIQDKEGFTILHYLVERCKRFWDDRETRSLTRVIKVLEQLNLSYQIEDHRESTPLELINIYLSKGSFNEDGVSEAPEDIMKFRKWLLNRR